MHIDGNDVDDLVSLQSGEFSSNLLNEVVDSDLDQSESLLHGGFGTSLQFFKSSGHVFGPHHLGS